ncbi:MAG: hypothetical protein GC181_00070 [Bacteroidetes bacterium]|nr:hypothetical protein [Bacteroidota bacterium]
MHRAHFNRLLFLSLILIPFAGNSIAQTQKKYPSLLWEITGNGSSKPSYLYGTMHVSDKLAFHLGDSFFLALKSCDYVALESDPEQWLEKVFDSAYLAQTGSYYFGPYYLSDFYRTAFSESELNTDWLKSGLKIGASMMNGILHRNTAYNAEYEEETYLDMYIYQAGRKYGKKLMGLEDFLKSDSMVRMSMLPDKDPESYTARMRDYRLFMAKTGKSPEEMMQDAYRNEDLDMVDSLQRMMNPSKNHQKLMLHDRNIIMARSIDSLIKTGVNIFSGVGAAHLAGEKGVIETLRAMGYTLRPVLRVIDEISKENRDKLEKTYVPKKMVPQSTSDGWVTVNIPGKLYELPSYGTMSVSVFPDLDNGTTYSLVRLEHNAILMNQTRDYIKKRIDSLLYENIPGKILEQKDIEIDGCKGFDILNKTKKSDYERYRILISPLEILIFKVSGTLDYLKDNNNLDEVFNSLHVHNEKKPQTVISDRGLSVQMPGRPVWEEKNKLARLMQNNLVDIKGVDSINNYYSVKRASLHDLEYIEEDSFEMHYMAREFNKKFKYTTASDSDLTFLNMPAYSISAKDTSGNWLHSFYFIDGPRYFQMLVRSKDSIWPEKFFSSFKWENPKIRTSYFEFEDTSCLYKVNTSARYVGWSSLGYQEKYRALTQKEDYSYTGKYENRRYYDPMSDELIEVNFQKFHKYYYCPSYDSLWRSVKYRWKDQTSLFLASTKMSEDSTSYEVELTDTNSNRKIISRSIVHGDRIYSVSYLTSENGKITPFVTTFLNSFTVEDDTLPSRPFNTEKTDWLMNDLLHGDSVEQVHAMRSLYQADFKDEDAPTIISLIESFHHDEFDLDNRLGLIERLGSLNHPDIHPYLTRLYNRSLDTPTIQLSVLTALADQKTKSSTKLFRKLMNSETPLIQGYGIKSLFYSLEDSIELRKSLYPFILQYSGYPEYKSEVYEFVADLLDSNVIKKRHLRKYKSEFLRVAKDDLKRLIAGESSGSSYDYDDYGYYSDYMGYAYADEETNYTGSQSVPSGDLTAYNKLLMPFKKDKSVQEYFDRTRRLKDERELLITSIQFADNGVYVNDTIWTHYSEDESTRFDLYSYLKKINHLELLNDSFKSDVYMARAMLFDGVSVENPDSVFLIETREINTGKLDGTLYLFKRPNENDRELWVFDYIVVINKGAIKDTYKIKRASSEYLDDEEMYKKVDEAAENLWYSDRPRVKRSYGGFNYYDYEEGY